MKPRNQHSYDTKSIQERILTIMEAVDKVCREHNLTYYLWAGTQLGAVRHNGFIPWDDDADIAMPRADYKILMEHAKEWMPSPLEIATHQTTANYPHYFARVQDTSTTMVIRKHLGYVEGVHIDIFPLDNVPNSKIGRFFHFSMLRRYHRLLYMSSRSPKKDNKKHKALLYSTIQKFINRTGMLIAVDKYIQKNNKKSTLYCTDSFYHSKGYVAYETLGKPVPYNFEGREFLGVENADRYLSEKYGDYMTIPSKENQRQHSVDYLDLNSPFATFDIKTLDE